MSVQHDIETKLAAALGLSHCEIIDESHKHNVPPGAESHFKAIIVSDDFAGMNPVRRHQRVYQILSDEMQRQVHALALHTYTVEEWRARQQDAPASPPCHGGEKRR